eukprot:9609345-Karenia_brevis.AAC.1
MKPVTSLPPGVNKMPSDKGSGHCELVLNAKQSLMTFDEKLTQFIKSVAVDATTWIVEVMPLDPEGADGQQTHPPSS